MRRLEEAARTESDFRVVVDEWNKLDRNRERRERDHEKLRGDVPLEYQAVSEPKLIPRWMNNPAYRQLMAGNFLDILFDCPYEMHQLSADSFISGMIENLSEEHKEVLYFLSLRLYSTTRLAACLLYTSGCDRLGQAADARHAGQRHRKPGAFVPPDALTWFLIP